MFDKIALLNVNLFVTKLQKQGGIRWLSRFQGCAWVSTFLTKLLLSISMILVFVYSFFFPSLINWCIVDFDMFRTLLSNHLSILFTLIWIVNMDVQENTTFEFLSFELLVAIWLLK
jgi:hypothetical protein